MRQAEGFRGAWEEAVDTSSRQRKMWREGETAMEGNERWAGPRQAGSFQSNLSRRTLCSLTDIQHAIGSVIIGHVFQFNSSMRTPANFSENGNTRAHLHTPGARPRAVCLLMFFSNTCLCREASQRKTCPGCAVQERPSRAPHHPLPAGGRKGG